jgi:hypothetical protein
VAAEFIVKVLDPGRVREVIRFLEGRFKLCPECGGFFDGEVQFCSPECDLAFHSDTEVGHFFDAEGRDG